jgi:hypothetical protein
MVRYEWAVGIRCIDKVDSKLDSAPQHANGFFRIARLSPNPFTRQLHDSITQPMDGKVSSNGICTGHRSINLFI